MGKNTTAYGHYRMIYTKIWDDNKVNHMSVEEKLLFFYLMTSPSSTQAGCYELPSLKVMANHTGISEKKLFSLLLSLRDKRQMIDFDDETNEVLICNFGKYSWDKRGLASVVEVSKNVKNLFMRNFLKFLTHNSYHEGNWDASVCSYYDGSWRTHPEIGEVNEVMAVNDTPDKTPKPTKTETAKTPVTVDDISDTSKRKTDFAFYIDNGLDGVSPEIKDALKDYYYTVHKNQCFKQVKSQIQNLLVYPEDVVLEAIKTATMNNYNGFYPKPNKTNGGYAKKVDKVEVTNNYTSNVSELGKYEVWK